MKRFRFLLTWLMLLTGGLLPAASIAQTVTIEQFMNAAEANFPAAKQLGIIEQMRGFTLDNLSKNNLPKMVVGGQATYQSEVTKLPISLPNLTIPTLSRDQYRLFAEVSQSLTEFGLTKKQQALAAANLDLESQKRQTELYQLKFKVAELYHASLLLDENRKQLALAEKDLANTRQKLSVLKQNGVAVEQDLYLLDAERIGLEQRLLEISNKKAGVLQALNLLTGLNISETTTFEKPQITVNQTINRPELQLFARQQTALEAEKALLQFKLRPQVNLFGQGGVGRPALNMLSNDFRGFYIVGIRANWYINHFFTAKNDRQLADLKLRTVGIQQETFLKNTQIELQEKLNELAKYEQLIQKDDELLEIRKKITQTAQTQRLNGTITTTELLTYLNAEEKAREQRALHETQKQHLAYIIKVISGN